MRFNVGNAYTPYIPPQLPPPAGVNSFIDNSGSAWVSRNGSQWRLARDVLHCSVYRSTGWNITNTGPYLTFDTSISDPYGMWPPTLGLGNAISLIPLLTGYYILTYNVALNATAPWAANAQVLSNTGRIAYITVNAASGLESWSQMDYSGVHHFNAGDQIVYQAFSNTATTLNGGSSYDLAGARLNYLGSG